ncbi:hypothetical protein TNCT_167891, partial [Trichonephila clavata]
GATPANGVIHGSPFDETGGNPLLDFERDFIALTIALEAIAA